MLEKLFGPRHTLKDAMQILEKGLRNGEISVDARTETEHAPEDGIATSNRRCAVGAKMIDGSDIVIPAKDEPETLDASVRIIREYWPQATFEDALTGDKYGHCADLPFGRLRELFVYPDASAEKAWDRGDANAATNSMLYLILSPGQLTVTLDDANTEQMRSVLESIRSRLATVASN